MDLELLKGCWNNWAWIIVVYLDELCTFVPDMEKMRSTGVWKSFWSLTMGFRSANKPKSLSCKNGPRILKWRWEKWICYISQAVFKRECFSSLLTSSYYTEVIIFNVRLSIITKLREQWHPCSFTIQFIHELAPRSLWIRLEVVTVFRYKKKA